MVRQMARFTSGFSSQPHHHCPPSLPLFNCPTGAGPSHFYAFLLAVLPFPPTSASPVKHSLLGARTLSSFAFPGPVLVVLFFCVPSWGHLSDLVLRGSLFRILLFSFQNPGLFIGPASRFSVISPPFSPQPPWRSSPNPPVLFFLLVFTPCTFSHQRPPNFDFSTFPQSSFWAQSGGPVAADLKIHFSFPSVLSHFPSPPSSFPQFMLEAVCASFRPTFLPFLPRRWRFNVSDRSICRPFLILCAKISN